MSNDATLPHSATFLDWPVYQLPRAQKRKLLEGELNRLTQHHAQHCKLFGRVLAARGIDPKHTDSLEDVPMIPVRLFKHYELRSIPEDAVFKTLFSSGTSGQTPSRIVLDKTTAQMQTATLVKIMQEFLGKARLPMLIIDHPGVIKDRRGFSARGAGILGLSNFGRAHVYALRDDMSLDLEALNNFAREHSGKPKLLFGFTFMVWQHFVLEIERQGITLDLNGGILIHSGGWKKLQALAVDDATFKRRVLAIAGVRRVHNFYGMVEQVGSVFFECEHGHLHTPSFAEVVVREAGTWIPLPAGHQGIVQVLSCLPRSYPGHSLLTEDLGTILGEDDCPCGRKGRYFLIHGRIPRAEVRGCSDTQPDGGGCMNSSQLSVVVPSDAKIDRLLAIDNLPPFGAHQIAFASALSRQLTTQAVARPFPELVALGFWLRQANLARLQQAFEKTRAGRTFLPRGLVLHIAPSNVDTIFVYSWMLSLLAGNRNLVRLSSKGSEQTRVLLALIGNVFLSPESQAIASRTMVVRYEHDDQISARLSSICDVRIVWGGDATVSRFRSYTLPVHATELNFPDKTSLCVIDASRLQQLDDAQLTDLAAAFCNDAFWFGQMACSSPRLIYWLGDPDTVNAISIRFWQFVRRELDGRGERVAAADSVNKEVIADMLAIELERVCIETSDPRVTRVLLSVPVLRDELHCGAGLFHEMRVDKLEELLPHLSRKIQTVSYFGVDVQRWRDLVENHIPRGIDRVVPVGQALDFDATWDGIDLIRALTREVVIR